MKYGNLQSTLHASISQYIEIFEIVKYVGIPNFIKTEYLVQNLNLNTL